MSRDWLDLVAWMWGKATFDVYGSHGQSKCSQQRRLTEHLMGFLAFSDRQEKEESTLGSAAVTKYRSPVRSSVVVYHALLQSSEATSASPISDPRKTVPHTTKGTKTSSNPAVRRHLEFTQNHDLEDTSGKRNEVR